MNSEWREQVGAVSFLRWRLFVNSLRSIRGRVNLVSRIFAGLLVAGAGLGGAIGVGVISWGIAAEGKLKLLAFPLWLIFLFWQLFPIMATAFTQNVDTSTLLRFPLSYSSYFALRMVYGALDIATALGLSWLCGLVIGVCVARPSLTLWVLLVTALFVTFNLLLARTIFVWIEHWLSRRHSREVMGVVFLLMMLGFQITGPLLQRYSRETSAERFRVLSKLAPMERALPPGLATAALVSADQDQNRAMGLNLALLVGFCALTTCFLHLRLMRQYRGDNIPEGNNARGGEPRNTTTMHRAWKLPLLSGAVSAVFEKELRYFSRSGPMLFTLIMPVIMVFILWGGRHAFLGQQLGFVFPAGAAYCVLVLTNIVYNSFGGDGSGIQFFFFCPISIRRITFGKNLAHFAVLAVDVAILWLGVRVIYQPPNLRVLAFTFSWLLFAVPLDFAIGNLLSVYSPKKIEYATFGRQRASETTIVASLGVQFAIVGIGGAVVYLSHFFGDLWKATYVLLVLAVPSIVTYFMLLNRLDRIALRRRDVLTAELCKT
jgi:ABC-2 type transport system permease protein